MNFLIPGLILIAVFVSSCRKTDADYLITGAKVFDGSANDPENIDLAIRGERIVFIGKKGSRRVKADRTIDATGLILAPGFIDPHTHALPNLESKRDRSLQPFLWQGVTTVFEGNDGSGPFPVGEKLDEFAANGIGINAGLFVGHGTVRKKVMGLKDTIAGVAEIDAMKELVRQGMADGAFGLSTGLFYSPGSFASTGEVIELARVAAEAGGIYDTHLRDEGSYGIGLAGSVKETIEISEKAGIPVHISHIKALGRDVWGESENIITMINEARARGLNVTANQYPYPASKTGLKAAVVPRWAEDGGNNAMIERFDDITLAEKLNAEIAANIYIRGGAEMIVFSENGRHSLRGLTLREASEKMGSGEVETVRSILRDSPGIGIVSFNMQEEDIMNFMKQEWVMTGSDGGEGHPRKYGTFPRKIKVYALEKGYLTLNEAIHRSTGLTAETLQIKERGWIKKGYYADIILFSLEDLNDEATFDEPSKYATGMKYIFVNGVITVDKGAYTGVLAGKALRLYD
ncbi:MAG: D-aminoacylase [Bacteroidales bacterium]|nr:D-aminoacylase [Bacteroidales bacterium]